MARLLVLPILGVPSDVELTRTPVDGKVHVTSINAVTQQRSIVELSLPKAKVFCLRKKETPVKAGPLQTLRVQNRSVDYHNGD